MDEREFVDVKCLVKFSLQNCTHQCLITSVEKGSTLCEFLSVNDDLIHKINYGFSSIFKDSKELKDLFDVDKLDVYIDDCLVLDNYRFTRHTIVTLVHTLPSELSEEFYKRMNK